MTCLPRRMSARHIGRMVARQIGLLLTSLQSSSPGADRSIPRWAVISAALSPVVLTVGWLIAGWLQPPSYSPLRQTVSVMAGYNGAHRWVMTGTLIAVGVCYLVTAFGLGGVRPVARIMLVAAGLCSFGIAASPEPPGGPSEVHLAWTAVGAVILVTWPAVAGWRGPRWPAMLSVRGRVVVTVLFAAMLAWVVLQTMGGQDLGLAERTMSSIQTAWPFVVAFSLRWAGRDSTDPDQADQEAEGSAGVLEPGRYPVHRQQQEPS